MKASLLMLFLVLSSWLARAADPTDSIYQLDVQITDQSGRVHGLDVHRGHPVLITLFYGGCAATCPLIMESLRATERALSPQQRANLRVLMVSIDPEHDTSARLRALAEARRVDDQRWVLAHADAETVRLIAAALNVQYRRLPNGQYNHSTVIALLTPSGVIKTTSSVLGSADPALLAALNR